VTESKISLTGVGKRYRKYEDSAVLLTRGVSRRRTRRSDIWALRGIDLEVDGGECLGVIGRNGGGKTTMLQVLAGVSAPTEGRVVVRGSVAPLMAVGVGFHPELTGRENIYLNAAILGRTREEIDESFDAIVAFADIGDFVDTPTKFYSSGMMVRLGFSVAIRSDPDVLLLDEVLAVGDVAFQARCFDRIQEIRADGTTVVMVSHNLDAVRLLCERVLVLNQGSPVFLGATKEALSIYHQLIQEDREPEQEARWSHGWAGDEPQLTSLELLAASGMRSGHVDSGEAATARVTVTGAPGQPCPDLELVISSGRGLVSYSESWPVASSFDGTGVLECDITFDADLPSGTYTTMVNLRSGERAISTAGPIAFFVSGRRGIRGMADLGAKFGRASGEASRVPSP
jgi:ABC-type polysaccharide/polyol phosphate transport system ATPase subunit